MQGSPLPLPRSSRAHSRNAPAHVLYILFIAAQIVLVWSLLFFPSQDGPSHLYNLVILRDLINGGTEWGTYYYCQLQAVPNLGFNLIAYPLLKLFPPLVTEKLFLTLYILLMGTSVPFFLRTFGKELFPYVYLAVPMIFNFNLMMGFYSYSIAIPAYLLAFSCCFRLRSRPLPVRFIVYNLAGIVIYFLHLVAFGIFVISLFSMALAEAAGSRKRLGGLAKQSVLLAPVVMYATSYLLNNSEAFTTAPSQGTDIPLWDKLDDLLTFSSASISVWQTGPSFVLLLVVMLLLTSGFMDTARDQRRPLPSEHNNLEAVRCLLYLETALIALCLFAPFRFGEGSLFNQRFPWVILLLALPLMDIPVRLFSARFISSLIVLIATLFTGVNWATFHQKSADIQSFLDGLSLNFPKGALIMTYNSPHDYFLTDPLLHAASHYGMRKGLIDIGNYEAQFRLFPVRFKGTLPTIPSQMQLERAAETIDWSRLPAIGYVCTWEQSESSLGRLMEFYDKIFDNGRLAVWKRREQRKRHAHINSNSGL